MAVHFFIMTAFLTTVVVEQDAPAPLIGFVQLADPDFTPIAVVDLPWEDLQNPNTALALGPPPEVAEPNGNVSPPPPPVQLPVPDAGLPDSELDDSGSGEQIVLGDSAGDVAAVVGGRGNRRIQGPSYASGILWVQPTHIVRDLDEALDAISRMGGIDQLVANKILAFLDTLARDSFAIASAPSWTTEIDGQTFGIDGKWVHLGPIKIPTMLLALLPMPQGNIEQSRSYAQLQRMRNEVLRQAQMMQNRAEIDGYIRQMRERNDRLREERRQQGGQREPVVTRDSIIT